jgi:predicted  nucleic acid-binding Zn-ribbon protein
MASSYWDPIFAKLLENLDFLKEICEDTSDADLLAWVKPNPLLWNKAARYIRRRKIHNRSGLINEIISFAGKEYSLRKIILFNWVEKNKITMSFPELPADQHALERLLNQEFGKPQKIKILAQIDPRDGMENFYARYFAEIEKSQEPENEVPDQKETEQTALQKVSAELEEVKRQLQQARDENRELGKEKKAKAHEMAMLQRSLAQKDSQINSLTERISNLNARILTLGSDARTVYRQNTKDTERLQRENIELNEKNHNLSIELEEIREQLAKANETIHSKNAALARQSDDLKALRQEATQEEDKDRKIENLQRLVEVTSQSGQHCYGQIFKLEKPGQRRKWYLLTFAEELIEIPAQLIRDNSICAAEFCKANLDQAQGVVSIDSLEPAKKIYTGYLDTEQQQAFLNTGSFKIPVFCELQDKIHDDRPRKGIFLPVFGTRQEGIYEIFALNTEQQKQEEIKTASCKAACRFLELQQLPADTLVQAFNHAGANCRLSAEGKIEFDRDYRATLSVLRHKLNIKPVCEQPACREKLDKTALPGRLKKAEVCFVCQKSKQKTQEPEINFAGRKLLIIGGDYIGKEYERYLQQFNAQADWISGFSHAKDRLAGVANYDLVVIIVRQVSHTMLREINKAIKDQQTNLLFAKKRGLSGLYNELKEYFNL